MRQNQGAREDAGERSAGTFRAAKTLFRVSGVPVRVDVSWLLIAGLVAFVFTTQFRMLLGDLGTGVVTLAAAVAALLFFASLLAHELGHALASVARGIPVLGVTLFLLGGVTESTAEARTAKDEFVVVGIGPYISLVLAGVFGLLFVPLQQYRVLAAVTGYLAWINLALAVFNVLPGYPLDGGRLLRSLLWMATGSPHRATRWAARVGQVFAVVLMGLGALTFTRAGGFSGVWEVLIGGFLLRGATEAHRHAAVRERIAGRTVGDVMMAVPPALAVDQPLSDAVVALQQRPSVLFPVTDADTLRGVVRLRDLDSVPRRDWWARAVGDVMTSVGQGQPVAVEAGDDLDGALDVLASAPGQQLVVTREGQPVGLLTPAQIAAAGRS